MKCQALAKPVLLVLLVIFVGGCSSNGGLRKTMDKAMQSIGLKKSKAELQKAAQASGYTLPLDIFAGVNLNAGTGTRPLALVVKLYQLRDIQRFQQAPFDSFLDAKHEQAALGNDLISSREVLLLPKQHYQVKEKMDKDAQYLGIVALFRGPAENRWRVVFEGRKSKNKGVTLGLHACALTVTEGKTPTHFNAPADSLSAVHCPAVGQ